MKQHNQHTKQKFQSRRLSLNERLYQIAEELAPPFCITYVLIGQGEWEENQVKKAVQKLGELFPMLGATVTGNRWQDTQQEIPVSFIATPLPSDWNDPVFQSPLSPQHVDFQFFTHANAAMVFRVSHRVMDAKGVQQVLKAFFSLLRDESVAAAPYFPADHTIRKQLTPPVKAKREGYAFRWASLPLHAEAPTSFETFGLSFSKSSPQALSQVAAWLTRQLGASTRFLIPVDIRRHEGCPEAAANLSLPLYLQVSLEETAAEIQERMLRQLYEKAELAGESFEHLGRSAPMALLRGLFTAGIKQASRKQQFPMSGFLSDNGTLSLADFSCSSFIADDMWAFPVFVPLAPFCMVALHHEAGTRLLISVPKGTETESFKKDLQELLTPISPSISPTTLTSFSTPILPEIRELWADVLEIAESDITPGHSFLELGGDSIKLLMLMTEIQQEYPSEQQSLLMEEVLNLAGSFDIQQFSLLTSTYHNPSLSPS